MRKKYLWVGLVVLLIIVLSVFIFRAIRKSSYPFGIEVYHSGVTGNEITNPDADKEKRLSIDGKTLTVHYDQTLYTERSMGSVDYYYSDDKVISCAYFPNTGKLFNLIVKDEAILEPLRSFTEENQFVEWLQAFAAQYYRENWDRYTYSCETKKRIEGIDSVGHDIIDGFITNVSENETISKYTFRFVRYIGGFPTSDEIEFRYSPQDNELVIQFSEHKFDFRIILFISKKDIEDRINAFTKEYSAKYHSSLRTYSVLSSYLTMIDNKPYVICLLKETAEGGGVCTISIKVEI